MKKRTILSLEQALSMPYATLRFAHLGWRVIRLEATPLTGNNQPGDPNRYIGSDIAEVDRHAYYVSPNVGKEAIAINLKTDEGRGILRQLINELEVDVFCCNTIPSRYEKLGIDYETLSAERPDLIWAGISAMGPDYPDVPGYDPMIQAMAGYMEVTGQADGPPTLAGIPIIDLKAGDEVYANVLLALLEQLESGTGKRIDVSMLQVAASWLITMLPLLDMDCAPEELSRWGSAHRKYIPTNVYPTSRGYIYVAIGSNAQWRRFTETKMFRAVGADTRRSETNFRYENREQIYREIGAITECYTGTKISEILREAKIPHSRINSIKDVHALDAVRRHMTKTLLPDGRPVQMQPMAVDLANVANEFSMAPRYGEHSVSILKEIGISDSTCRNLLDAGIIAGPPSTNES